MHSAQPESVCDRPQALHVSESASLVREIGRDEAKGILISFEGLEGCGKSTQIALLEERLKSEGHTNLVRTRAPGGTPAAEDIRQVFKHGHALSGLTELLLVNAAFNELVTDVIVPALQTRAIVLIDRFIDSTVAYQGYGRQLGTTGILNVVTKYICGTVTPTLTFLIQVPYELSKSRLRKRDKTTKNDRFDLEGPEFFERVRRGYANIAEMNLNRVRRIDGRGRPESIAEEIWAHTRQTLEQFGFQ